MKELLQVFIQMYIDILADYQMNDYTEDTIKFLQSSANATRNYMKAKGEWIENE